MTRGLTPQDPATVLERLEDITVTDIGALELDRLSLERVFQSEITHHGTDHGAP